VLRLIGIDERRKHVEAIAFACAALGASQVFDFGERPLVVCLAADRLQLTCRAAPPWRTVAGMRRRRQPRYPLRSVKAAFTDVRRLNRTVTSALGG
jgi:hypothetical protein